ncbi:hypothetical protein R4P64_29845 [Rhodococcus sp. IEGM 1366]|uniref:hypothetical protein n=1 Tax=Rhodococcus sp. IEGM 1366 TaxID=3082223 RepID=UPI002953C867|nr:hypothetical protein [Rhodococcus sp. IEGM 1366]MDV8070737.1 hypothetical protein [Rhodococcus sp. IEGM 1366]
MGYPLHEALGGDVAFVIDAYSRRILGWRTSTMMAAPLAFKPLEHAPRSLIIHTPDGYMSAQLWLADPTLDTTAPSARNSGGYLVVPTMMSFLGLHDQTWFGSLRVRGDS